MTFSNLGSIKPPNDIYILDPHFPDRLATSGYWNTITFIQRLFKNYAQAGLSKESDREVAISGLLRRMDRTLRSQHSYGIFNCFMSRLLLWRVPSNIPCGTTNTSTAGERPPSWSWMAYNQIEFFPDNPIEILPGSITFDDNLDLDNTLEPRKLFVPIQRLQETCKISQQDGRYMVQDDNHKVGQIWFDQKPDTTANDCVVIARQTDNYFFLLVSQTPDGHYKRIGAGEILGRCFSDGYWRGKIV